MSIDGGDEVYAIVMDMGSNTTRIGFAGEDTPKSEYPSYIGARDGVENQKMSDGDQPNTHFVGTKSINYRRDNMRLESPFKDGIVENWDHIEKLVAHGLSDRLCVETKEHPIIINEVPHNTDESRVKMMELLFEQFEAPAAFLGKNPVLSAFACGKYTGMIVDSGADITVASAVYEGYVLNQGTVYNRFAGNYVADEILKYIDGIGQPVNPPYTYKFEKNASGITSPVFRSFPKTHPSYVLWSKRNVVEEIKQSILQVQELPFNNAKSTTLEYELPDQTKIQMDDKRYAIPEQFFTPSAVLDRKNQTEFCSTVPELPQDVKLITDPSRKAFHMLANEAINRCQPDVRKDMFGTCILTGGNSLIRGASKRFEKELCAIAPSNLRIKVICSSSFPSERKYTTWMGGSILGSLGSFQLMWMSAEQYQEHGPSLVHRKCP